MGNPAQALTVGAPAGCSDSSAVSQDPWSMELQPMASAEVLEKGVLVIHFKSFSFLGLRRSAFFMEGD